MWKGGVQELGVLSRLLPHFPEPQAHAIPSPYWEGGHWTASASHGKQRRHFRAISAIQNHYCLTLLRSTKLSSPHETSPPPFPQKGKSKSWKPSVENCCQGLSETEEQSLCHDLVQNPTSQLFCLAVNPLLPSTSLMLTMLLQLPSQIFTQTWLFPQACTW